MLAAIIPALAGEKPFERFAGIALQFAGTDSQAQPTNETLWWCQLFFVRVVLRATPVDE